MLSWKRLFVLAIFFCYCGNVYADKLAKTLSFKTIVLKRNSFDWGQELNLTVKGEAEEWLENATFVITICYMGKEVQAFTYTIRNRTNKKRNFFRFENQWLTLNEPMQEILQGIYKINITLILDRQTEEIQKQWKKRFGKQTFSISKEFEFEKQKTKILAEDLKKFYIERIKKLNELYKILQEKKQAAYKPRGFSEPVWRRWFIKDFIKKVQTEQEILEKHRQRVFFPYYPVTHSNMEKYAQLIERIGNLTSIRLCNYYKVRYSSRHYWVDPDALKDIDRLNSLIEHLHGQCASELKISLRKVLGFLPPPRLY